VTNGRDRLLGLVKVAHDFQDARIQPDVFDSASTGNHHRIVIFCLDLIEGGLSAKIVPPFLGVGLVAFKIVNCR